MTTASLSGEFKIVAPLVDFELRLRAAQFRQLGARQVAELFLRRSEHHLHALAREAEMIGDDETVTAIVPFADEHEETPRARIDRKDALGHRFRPRLPSMRRR